MTQAQIVWRPVLGFESMYEVSSDGRVRSVDRFVAQENRGGQCMRHIRGRQLKTSVSRGYTVIDLWANGRAARRGVHRVMLEAFIGPCPEGMEVCHNDGRRDNNVLSNLRYGTPAQNGRDRVDHGNSRPGSQSHLAKLDESTVLRIREEAGQLTRKELSVKFHVPIANLSYILRRETWRHI
jgi:hypothetical protein